MTLAHRILSFQKHLALGSTLPKDVEVMNPYRDKNIFPLCEKFYEKFYDDDRPRAMILGINPGRLGGGITGIPFTDPLKLESLGISNTLPRKRELSADFIYQMIDAYGGAKKFYSKIYVSAVSPLGFTKDGKNLNYYDIKGLPELLNEFIVTCLRAQLSWGLSHDAGYCLGEGENYKFLKKLNALHGFFREVIPLPHPRFIMQYRRKKIDQFINLYLERLP